MPYKELNSFNEISQLQNNGLNYFYGMEDFDSFFIICILICILFFISLLLIRKFIHKKKAKRKTLFILWNLNLTLFLFGLIFLIGESYFRFSIDTTDSFSINKISKRWKARHYQFNNSNCRDKVDYFNKIKKGKRRITIFGDSFTIGQGIEDIDDRFSNILAQKLNNVEVHNVAKDGASSASQLLQLKETKDKGYELDIVILAYCLNDIDYLIPEAEPIYERIHAFNNGLNLLEKQSYFINWLSFRYFAYKDPDLIHYSDFVLKGYKGQSWNKHKTVLQNIIRSVYEQNGRIMVVTFPFLQHTAENYPFREIHTQLDDFWINQNIPHLDLLSSFEPYLGPELTVNNYDAHPNELSNKIAAEEIVKFLNQLRR